MDTIGPYRLLEVLADRHDGKVWRAADPRGSVATVAVLADSAEEARRAAFRESADPPGRNQVLASDLTSGTPWVAFVDDGGGRAGALFDLVEEVPTARGTAVEPRTETPHHVPPLSPAASPVTPAIPPQETTAAPAPFSAPLAQLAPAAQGGRAVAPVPADDAARTADPASNSLQANGMPEGVTQSAYGTASPGSPVNNVESDFGQRTVLMPPTTPDTAPLPRPEFTYDTAAPPGPIVHSPPPQPAAGSPVSPVYGAPYSGLPAYGSHDPSAPVQPAPQPPAPASPPVPQPYSAPPQQAGPPYSAPPVQAGPPYSAPPVQPGPPYSAPPVQPGPPYSAPPVQAGPPYSAPPVHQQAPFRGPPPFAGQPRSVPPQPFSGPPGHQPYSAPPASSAPPWQQHPPQVVPPLPPAAPLLDDDEPGGLRNPKVIAVLVAVVALVLGGGGAAFWVATKGGEADPRPSAAPKQSAPASTGTTPSATVSPGGQLPTKSSDVSPPIPTGQPGVEPPTAGHAPSWPSFGSTESTVRISDLAGIDFALTLPHGWQCVLAQQSDLGVRQSCGGRGAGVEIGGDLSVRRCSIPCDPKRKIAMRKKENAWGLRWVRIDGHTAYVETQTLRGADGKKRYGLVLVRYFHGTPGGPLDKQLVLRMTAPIDRAADLRKLAKDLLEKVR